MEMRNGFLGRMGEGGGGGGGGAGLGWPIGASPAPTQVAPSPKMQPPPSTAAAAAVGIVGAQSHQHQQPATMTGPPTGVSCKQRAKNGNSAHLKKLLDVNLNNGKTNGDKSKISIRVLLEKTEKSENPMAFTPGVLLL